MQHSWKLILIIWLNYKYIEYDFERITLKEKLLKE